MALSEMTDQFELWLRNLIRDEIRCVFDVSPVDRHEPSDSAASLSLMSVKEVAKFLGVSEPMIHRLLRQGKLGHYRIGRRLLFSIDEHVRPFLTASVAASQKNRS